MVEYRNWYQVLRPIGSHVQERSRVEILKLPDESDLRLRDKIRSMPLKSEERPIHNLVVPSTPSGTSLVDRSFSMQMSGEEMIMTRNLKKRQESNTYLSPKLDKFQDQEEEIKSIFWNLLETVNPECSDDIDLEAIRDFLKKREEALGRREPDDSDLDVFDKYGLGMHARKWGDTDDGGHKRTPFAGVDDLMAMVDKMVEERTKPIPEGHDMYDKNHPISGKVRFRREEINGPREYTDLDEQLDFADLTKNVNFDKFLVMKGRGRFDSKGNFIPFGDADDNRKKLGQGKGKGDRKKSRKKRGRKGSDDDSDDETGRNQKSGSKGKLKSPSEEKKDWDDRNRPRKYPEWDFPLCNYPRWVHRMYRMDQEKIGQLIKQGMDVPEYCPPWMTQLLDRVWRGKNSGTRGEKPSDLRKRTLKSRKSQSDGVRGRGKATKTTLGDQNEGKLGLQEGKDGIAVGATEHGAETDGIKAGGSTTSFGIGDFLKDYEQEILDLAKLENDSDYEEKRHVDDRFDINDMIAEYENHLQQEEDILRGQEERKRRLLEEKSRKLKERQEIAMKKAFDENKKLLQKQRLEDEDEIRKQRMLEKSTDRSTFGPGGTRLFGKRRSRKSKKFKKVCAATEPCSEFKTRPYDAANDEECMKRFKVLLHGQNQVRKEDQFIEVVNKIPLFKYEKAVIRRTPCERAVLPIC